MRHGAKAWGTAQTERFETQIEWSTGLEDLKRQTYEEHVKCQSCMIGKATLEDFPKIRQVKVKPLHQINVDSFSSSVASVEGESHAVVY